MGILTSLPMSHTPISLKSPIHPVPSQTFMDRLLIDCMF